MKLALTSPLPLLKAGVKGPPIFVAHGLGGSVMELSGLVRHIQVPNPIFGLQAKGMDGESAPLESIEDMAQFFLDAIEEVQPNGPYLLIGYSLGGLVALEMAQRLLVQGREALLTMVDSYPHARHLSSRERVRLFTRLTKRRAAAVLNRATRGGRRVSTPRAVLDSGAMHRVRDGAAIALRHYRPRPYNGRIHFVRAGIGTVFPDDPVAVWAHLASEFQMETLPCDHLGLITTHAAELAGVLTRHWKGALCQR